MTSEREVLLRKYVYEHDGMGTPLYTIKFPEDYTGKRTLGELYKINAESFDGITYMISYYMVNAVYREYYWEGEFTTEKIIADDTAISGAKVIEFEGKKTIVIYGED